MVVVKANAYGHGATRICEQLPEADAFAVARVCEAVELRESGITHRLVVLEGFIDNEEQKICHDFDLIPVIHSEYQLQMLDPTLSVWLKVNSGMSRLGFSIEELGLISAQAQGKNIIGLMSHLANAGDNKSDKRQLEMFTHFSQQLSLPGDKSLANSGGIMSFPESHLDWIRPGIAIYGGSPFSARDERLKAGMTLTAPVLAINRLKKGDSIGYGGTWTAEKPCRVAVVGLGYADGYPREMPEGTPVLLGEYRRRLIGRISMDMSFVELEDDDRTKPGDPVIFWGEELSIDEIAARGNTISYTLMSGLTTRVQRIYRN